MPNNIAYTSIKFVIIDLIGDILYWPIWWYTKGLFGAIKYTTNSIQGMQESLGLRIWIKNIFTPMFGQYDMEGRIISFFVRIIQIIVRSFILFLWTILSFFIFIAWIIVPIIIVYQVWENLIALF